MQQSSFEIRIKGKSFMVPSAQVDGHTVIATGKWVKTARVHDEEWTSGQIVKAPADFIARVKEQGLKADVFTFAQKVPDSEPKYPGYYEMDNVAVVPLTTYEDWWEKRIPQESRKNVRRAARRGVTVKAVELDDELIRGITEIYNETPIRQGVPFGHFGKNFDTVKKEASTLMDRSEFIGAYFQNELIGFIKLVYMGELSSILHIVSFNRHYDKRPTNALLAKAVEISCQRGKSFLIYGKYIYGNKSVSSLTEFKHRNGFVKMEFPQYYIPLTIKGRIFLKLGFHRGLLGVLPPKMITVLINLRAWIVRKIVLPLRAAPKPGKSTPNVTPGLEQDEAAG
jgi:hypothetical protein